MIERNKKNEIVINKSRFINYLFIIESLDDVENYLSQIKEEYKDATHYCYAYILDNTKRFSDDNEPSGTAGVPMLNVLENNNLNHILAITIRYFGGIKLGAGGLVRAYTKSVTENLKDLNIYEYVDGFSFDVKIPYELKEIMETKLKEYTTSKIYNDFINYSLCTKKDKFEELEKIFSKYNIKIENLSKTKIKEND